MNAKKVILVIMDGWGLGKVKSSDIVLLSGEASSIINIEDF